MRPVCVFANAPSREIEQVRDDLRGRWRQAMRAVMVLLSLHGLSPAQIADLLECHPATARRWISRFNAGGLGGRWLARRIAALLERPGPWTLPGSGGTWATPMSACARCTGGCARSRCGGGPSSLPAATPITTT